MSLQGFRHVSRLGPFFCPRDSEALSRGACNPCFEAQNGRLSKHPGTTPGRSHSPKIDIRPTDFNMTGFRYPGELGLQQIFKLGKSKWGLSNGGLRPPSAICAQSSTIVHSCGHFGPLSKGNFRREMTTIVGNREQLWTSTLSPHLLSPPSDFRNFNRSQRFTNARKETLRVKAHKGIWWSGCSEVSRGQLGGFHAGCPDLTTPIPLGMTV